MSLPLFRVAYWDAPVPLGSGGYHELPGVLTFQEASRLLESLTRRFPRRRYILRRAVVDSRQKMVSAAVRLGLARPREASRLTRAQLQILLAGGRVAPSGEVELKIGAADAAPGRLK